MHHQHDAVLGLRTVLSVIRDAAHALLISTNKQLAVHIPYAELGALHQVTNFVHTIDIKREVHQVFRRHMILACSSLYCL